MNFFAPYRIELHRLAQEFGIQRLYAFGSVLTNEFKSDSDIDLLVAFDERGLPPEEIGERYWNLLEALQKLFGRTVDLQRDRTFRNPYFRDELHRTKRLIYDRSSEKVFG